jgi:biotin carboxyl carrier protein
VEIDGLVSRVVTDEDAGGIRVSGPDGRDRFQVLGPDTESGAESADAGPVAPLPGTVAAVEVTPGQAVLEGQTLVILEAMKMEHRITAHTDAIVAEVLVMPGQAVDAHQVLVTFEQGDQP